MENKSQSHKPSNSLKGLPVQKLAAAQQYQGQKNNCVLHTLASILNLQYGGDVDGAALARTIDQNWVKLPFYYRMAPNWATTPRQAERILHMLARKDKLRLKTQLRKCSDQYLRDTLQYSHSTYPILTFLWLSNGPQLLSHRGKQQIMMKPSKGFGAHTMLLAVYDPTNTNQKGVPHPWGFINSWAEETITDLFWMDDATWQRLKKLNTLLVRFS